MSRPATRRAATLLATVGALLTAAFAAAPHADAATLYACVKKEGGSMRFVSAKTKCHRRSERKVSWSTTGPAGKNGTNGKNGSNGSNGANGTNGANLTSQTPLASGQSESGAFAVGGSTETASTFVGEGISFAQPVSGGIAENHVVYNTKGVTTPQCPGSGKAAAGFVCMYESEATNFTFFIARNFALTANAADPFGFAAFWKVTTTGSGFAAGTWTVTAG